MDKSWLWVVTLVVGVVCPPAIALEPQLQVGIVQRFGLSSQDQVEIRGDGGGQLLLKTEAGDGSPLTLRAKTVTLEIGGAALPERELREYVVLSDHATFETAEDSANQWRSLGLEVEITQPDRWQVWAKREVYSTPLLRRLLLQSLQARGYGQAYIATNFVRSHSLVSFVVDGYRYNRTNIAIESSTDRFRVAIDQSEYDHEGLYAGELTIQPNAYGDFTLVNTVPLETYLRGVVPYEIGPNAPSNAIQAQTIIARTYALRNLRRFEADNYELCATVHCQVYKGLERTNPRVDQAIAATNGQVLTYKNELVDALYSSTTGGVTASFGDIWNGDERPYLQAVIDAPNPLWDLNRHSLASEESIKQFLNLTDGFNESSRTVFRWKKERSLKDLGDDLRDYLKKTKHPLADFTTLNRLTITQRSRSGRILEMEAQTNLGVVKLYKTEVRSAFAPPISTLFYLEPMYQNGNILQGYRFVGGGFGHGVGLSQYGSYNLANLGWSPQRILNFYYPNTVIQALNSSITFWSEP